jgi:hypothetical protein
MVKPWFYNIISNLYQILRTKLLNADTVIGNNTFQGFTISVGSIETRSRVMLEYTGYM